MSLFSAVVQGHLSLACKSAGLRKPFYLTAKPSPVTVHLEVCVCDCVLGDPP